MNFEEDIFRKRVILFDKLEPFGFKKIDNIGTFFVFLLGICNKQPIAPHKNFFVWLTASYRLRRDIKEPLNTPPHYPVIPTSPAPEGARLRTTATRIPQHLKRSAPTFPHCNVPALQRQLDSAPIIPL